MRPLSSQRRFFSPKPKYMNSPGLSNLPRTAHSRRVIINADDFGLCAPVNQAIIDAFKAGNLTSTTCMVNMPGTEQAAQLAVEHPRLGIGLHFCLTEGRPLTKAASLVDAAGNFLERGQLMRRLLRGQVSAADLTAEFDAQLRRLRELGMLPTHTDSHQHVHMNPTVFRAMLPVLRAEQLPVRLAVPVAPGVGLLLRRPVKFLKQTVLYRASQQFRRQLNAPTNDLLVSIHDLDLPAAALTSATLRDLVEQAPTAARVVELMVHPYLPGSELDALYPGDLPTRRPFFEKCYAEHRLLSGAPLFDADSLITYGQL